MSGLKDMYHMKQRILGKLSMVPSLVSLVQSVGTKVLDGPRSDL